MAHDASVLQHYLKPLQACLEPAGVTEVVVNRPGELGIEREGDWEWRAAPDLTETWLSTLAKAAAARSEEHTSELQSLMRISYAVFCLTQKKKPHTTSTLA